MVSGRVTSRLHYWRGWLALGIVLALVVVYLSLADIYMPQVPSTIGDKINHLLAYGALMGWFGQLFTTNRKRIVIAICLVALGILMEYLQGLTSYRHFDLYDAVANTLGVVGGMLALYFGAGKILLWFESRYLKTS